MLAVLLAVADGTETRLLPRELKILGLLVADPEAVVSRETLMNEAWGLDYYGMTRTVDQTVANLRQKLGPRHPERPRRRLSSGCVAGGTRITDFLTGQWQTGTLSAAAARGAARPELFRAHHCSHFASQNSPAGSVDAPMWLL